MSNQTLYAAFAADQLLRRGSLAEVLAAIKLCDGLDEQPPVLIFDLDSGQQVDFNLSGSLEDVLRQATRGELPRRPGRPRLGVEGREVSLLPRHWAWLERQPNGTSAALRRLIDEAAKRTTPDHIARARRDATYRVMSALSGNRVGFESAARALFRGDYGGFDQLIATWPADIRDLLTWMLESSNDGGDTRA